ncbi:MAG: serine/threonine protein kinase [Lentisphaeria bacterium]|nr:serine/threonine protein kinase [Lentisphaeria bacterium]
MSTFNNNTPEFDDDYTIYLSEEAQETLAAYVCSSCGSEMLPEDDGSSWLQCTCCGKRKQVNFYDIGIGDELCGAKVLRTLGGGASGTLFLCEYPDGSRCVIKILKKENRQDPENRQRFELEAEILSDLDHPGIVKLIDFRQESDMLCMIMEYVDGYNLLQMISQEFYFSAETALEMLYGLADIFRYAWESKHLLHRDIKPANIMINSDGELKVLDFGLSKQCDTDTGLTSAGQTLGSPGFMSPEQFRDSRIYDCRSDIFSLGVTIYFVLAQGKMPYAGRSPLAAYQNIMTTTPVPLCEVNTEVPQMFSDLVMDMVDKDINLRPASWEMVMSRIEEIANTL